MVCVRIPRPFVSKFTFLRMTSMQRVLLKLLRILRFVRNYIVSRAAGSWSLLTVFLGRRMNEFRRSWNRKPGTSRNPRTAEPLLPGNRATSDSTSGGSAVLGEYVVAASTVPRLAASSASFQEDAGQSAIVPPSPTSSTSIPASLSVHQPHPLYGINRTASSSGNLSGWSGQSRASERLSRIVNSRELLHVPVDQPPQPRRGIHRQFGPAVDPPTSRGQLSRSPSPSYRQNITNSDSRLAITTTSYVHSHPHNADEGRSPVVLPSSSSSMHGPLGPLTNRNMWSGSSTSIKLSIQGPSTESLRTASMEESMATDPAHSTPSHSAMGQSETASQHSTIASYATSEFVSPTGRRRVRLIHSEQIEMSRYNIVTTM